MFVCVCVYHSIEISIDKANVIFIFHHIAFQATRRRRAQTRSQNEMQFKDLKTTHSECTYCISRLDGRSFWLCDV